MTVVPSAMPAATIIAGPWSPLVSLVLVAGGDDGELVDIVTQNPNFYLRSAKALHKTGAWTTRGGFEAAIYIKETRHLPSRRILRRSSSRDQMRRM